MKRTIMTLVASLAIIAITIAQVPDRIPAKGFTMFSAKDTFYLHEFTRRAVGDNDIQIEILYAGICRTVLHTEWDEQQEQYATYPMIL